MGKHAAFFLETSFLPDGCRLQNIGRVVQACPNRHNVAPKVFGHRAVLEILGIERPALNGGPWTVHAQSD